MEPQRDLAAQVVAFLEREGWSPLPLDDEAIVVAPASGLSGDWTVAVVCTDDERIVVYSVLPVGVAAEHRAAVDTVLARINEGMLLGNFECDADEGVVRYKTSIGVAGVEVTDALLRELVYPNVTTVDRYFDVVKSVADGDLAADRALEILQTPQT